MSACTHNGRLVWLLNLIDEHRRECLMIRPEQRRSNLLGNVVDVVNGNATEPDYENAAARKYDSSGCTNTNMRFSDGLGIRRSNTFLGWQLIRRSATIARSDELRA